MEFILENNMCTFAGIFTFDNKKYNYGTNPYTKRKNSSAYEVFFSGEIYNLNELFQDLEYRGYDLNPDLTEEIILSLYMEYGVNFVSKLTGVFSIAIIDHNNSELHLYRDRVGAKPLFYHKALAGIIFGSSQDSLFDFSGFTPELSLEGLRELLAIGPGHKGGNCIFKNMYEVLPGHYLTFSKYGKCDTCYWDLNYAPHQDDYATTVLRVRQLLTDAVEMQCKSPGPLCAFLSGGLDSSLVSAIARDYLDKKGLSLDTYSFDFVGNMEFFQSNSFQPELDRPYVDKMVNLLNTNHTYLECDNKSLFDYLFKSVDARNVPGMADVDSSILFFCSAVAKRHTIALTGECSDEVFGGYPWFYKDEFKNLTIFPWSRDFSSREFLLNDSWIKRLQLEECARDFYQSAISELAFPEEEAKQAHSRKITYLNIKWFMQTLLDRMDRAGTFAGITGRIPFADHKLMEYVFNIPFDMKYHDNTEKALLRDAFTDKLPDQLLHRKKSPYPKTYNPGYQKLLTEKMKAILSDTDSPLLPLLDKNKVNLFLETPSEYGKPWYGQLMAAPQLIAYYIQIDYWMRKYNLCLPT